MKVLDAAFEIGGGALAGALDAHQALGAAPAGSVGALVPAGVTYGTAAGVVAGAVGFFGKSLVGASVAEKALSAGVGMLSFEAGRIAAQRVQAAGTAPATQGRFRGGHVGALPPPRQTATEDEVRQSIALLQSMR